MHQAQHPAPGSLTCISTDLSQFLFRSQDFGNVLDRAAVGVFGAIPQLQYLGEGRRAPRTNKQTRRHSYGGQSGHYYAADWCAAGSFPTRSQRTHVTGRTAASARSETTPSVPLKPGEIITDTCHLSNGKVSKPKALVGFWQRMAAKTVKMCVF